MLKKNTRPYYPPGRALHLIDVENLMGGPLNGPEFLDRTLSRYRSIARVAESDHKVIGVNPALCLIVYHCWPSADVRPRAGPDGADLELIQYVADREWIADRYDRLVVGSGDGDFTEVTRAYRDAGLPVEVVARQGSLSLRLQTAATLVRILPDIDLPEAA